MRLLMHPLVAPATAVVRGAYRALPVPRQTIRGQHTSGSVSLLLARPTPSYIPSSSHRPYHTRHRLNLSVTPYHKMSSNEPQPISAETLSSPKSVAIITFSTRTPRVGPHVASLVKSIIETNQEASSNLTLHPIDLATFNLPVYNEPVIPAMVPEKASFTHEHSKAWSAAISAHDAYVLVVPEYNGMSGGTKNAIDYLYNEWGGKPALVVSYGIQGGKLASEQVHVVLERQKLRTTATRPNLTFFGSHGPELYAAMLKGELGEETRKQWTGEESVNVLKAFGELRALLFEPIPLLEEKTAA